MDYTSESYSSTTEQTLLPTSQTPGPQDTNRDLSEGSIENSIYVRVAYGIIVLIGLIGNFLVCFTLLKIPSLRSRTSFFIIHLAITDMLSVTWVIPFHVFPYKSPFPQQPAYDALCRLFYSRLPFWSTMNASMLSVLLVTVERFTAVVFPVKYKTIFTRKNSKFMLAALWFISIISNWYFFHIFGLREGRCNSEWPSRLYQVLMGTFLPTVYFVIPVGFMLFAHLKMIMELKQRERQMNAGRSENDRNGQLVENENEAWQRKATKQLINTLLWVVITYAACWAPNQIIFFAYNMGAPVDFSKLYYHLSVLLGIGNSCMNPIIYSWKNKAYRSGIKEALNWKSNRVNVQHEAMTTRGNGAM